MAVIDFEDCAMAVREGDYDLEPHQVHFFFNVLHGVPMPDWVIIVPKQYVELIMDKAEETESHVVIRLRRKLTPELIEYRKQIGVTE